MIEKVHREGNMQAKNTQRKQVLNAKEIQSGERSMVAVDR
jgi:hypothetical protein